jgi:DNA polymerase-3 subunit delta'
MQQDLALRPLEGRRRVVIIDDAADLSEHAEVALLKTLEEPPAHAVLLLITPTPSRLLDTIRSRLQPLPFRSVARAEIERALVARFGQGAARFAAPAAGKPGIAFALATDDGVRATRRQFEAEFYRLVGSKLTERFAWAAALADERDTQKRSELIETRLVSWSELVRDAAVAGTGVADRAMRPDRDEESRRLAAHVTTRDLVELAQRMERWRRDVVETTVSARLLLELFVLKLPYDKTFAEAA